MSTISSVSPDLFLLSSVQDFQAQSLLLLNRSRRKIAILSDELDEAIYGTDDFVQAMSSFVRASRYAHVQILVRNTKPIIEAGHKLAKLHQRLSSKILFRKITVEPDNTDMGFMLCDTDALLYKNDERVYQGFANFKAAAEVKRFREVFDYVWQHAEAEPELQILHLWPLTLLSAHFNTTRYTALQYTPEDQARILLVQISHKL